MDTNSGPTPTAMLSDTLLIRHILDGDTALFRQLASRYAAPVMQMVARLLPSVEEAEEAAQDVLLAAYQSLGRFDAQKASFQTWLIRIAYHTAVKRYRQHQKSIPMAEVEQHRLDNIPDSETDALLDSTAANRVAAMERAIALLPPDDQMLLSLYYFDNRPIREISIIMERQESYLRSRLQWIRKRLALLIKTLESNEQL